MTTTTERICHAETENGTYEVFVDQIGYWVIVHAHEDGADDLLGLVSDEPGLDAQIVLDRFLATLTRCAICNRPTPDAELKGQWDGPRGAEVWVDLCPFCRGEE